jgi:IS5 family transposase
MLELFRHQTGMSIMFTIEEFIITVYCEVDEALKVLISEQPIRSRGFAPALSDAELIAMEVIAEFQGMDRDKTIWQYFSRHWRDWFPNLPSRSSFVRQSANLWQYKQRIQHQLAEKLNAFEDDVHLIDGLPIQLCCLTYATRCQSFQGVASYGYCAAKDEKFYGFRGHLNISLRGVITGFAITAANADEREALWETIESTRGLLIGDKGYLNTLLKQDLAQIDIELETPLRKNMKDDRPQSQIRFGQKVRRLIETVNSQLSERFHFEHIRCRDLWHLTSRVNRKILAHTLCCWLNHKLGRQLLQFDGLICDC